MPEGVELPRGGTVEAWTALAAKYPGSYPVQMAAGQALASANAREAAIAAYERAAALVPFATGADSPRARLADLAERGGDLRRALARAVVARGGRSHQHRRRAPARRDSRGAWATRRPHALAWNRIVVIDPFDAGAHTALGRIAVERQGARRSRCASSARRSRPGPPIPRRRTATWPRRC